MKFAIEVCFDDTTTKGGQAPRHRTSTAKWKPSMKFAIEVCFDDTTTNELINVWNLLRDRGLAEPQTAKRPYMPLVSLAVMPNLDLGKFSSYLREIAHRHRPFNLLFAHLGLFRSEKEILFVAPQDMRAIKLG